MCENLDFDSCYTQDHICMKLKNDKKYKKKMFKMVNFIITKGEDDIQFWSADMIYSNKKLSQKNLDTIQAYSISQIIKAMFINILVDLRFYGQDRKSHYFNEFGTVSFFVLWDERYVSFAINGDSLVFKNAVEIPDSDCCSDNYRG